MAAKGNLISISAVRDPVSGDPTATGVGVYWAVLDPLAATAANSTITLATAGSGYRGEGELEGETVSIIGGMVLYIVSVDENGGVTEFSVLDYGDATHAGTDVVTTPVEGESTGSGFKVDIAVNPALIARKGLFLLAGLYQCYLKITSVDGNGGITGLTMVDYGGNYSGGYDYSGTYYLSSEINRVWVDAELHLHQRLPGYVPTPEDPLYDSWPTYQTLINDGTVIVSQAPDPTMAALIGGAAYNVGDILHITETRGSGSETPDQLATCRVETVDTNGKILTLSIVTPGSGYEKYDDSIGTVPHPYYSYEGTPITLTDFAPVDWFVTKEGESGEYFACTFNLQYDYSKSNAYTEPLPRDGTYDTRPSDAFFYVSEVNEYIPGEGDPRPDLGYLKTHVMITGGADKRYSVGDIVCLEGASLYSDGFPYIATVTAIDGLTATAATDLSNSHFTANWNAYDGAVSYQLDVATDSGFTSYVTGYQNKSVSGLSDSVIGLPFPNSSAGVHVYYYRIRAVLADSVTDNSNIITATIPTPTVTARTASGVTPIAFTANWDNVEDAASYLITVSTGESFESPVEGYLNKSVDTNTCAVVGLTGGVKYQYRVAAVINGWTTATSNVIDTTLPVQKLPPDTRWVMYEDPATGKQYFKLERTSDGTGDKDAYQVIATPIATIKSESFLPPVFGTVTKCATVIRFDVTIPASATGYYIELSDDPSFTQTNPLGTFRSKVYPADNLTVFFDLLTDSTLYFLRAYSILTEISGDEATVSVSEYSETTITTTPDGYVCPTSAGLTVPQDQFIPEGAAFMDLAMTTFVFGQELIPNTRYKIKMRTYLYNTEGSGSTSNADWSDWSEELSFLTPLSAPYALPATITPSMGYLWSANWAWTSDAEKWKLHVFDSNGVEISASPITVDKGISTVGLSYLGVAVSGSYYVRSGIYDSVNGMWVWSSPSNRITFSYVPIALPATDRTDSSFTANWSNTIVGMTYYLDVARNSSFGETDLNPGSSLDIPYINKLVSGTSLNIPNLMSEVSALAYGTSYFYRIRGKYGSSYTQYSNVIKTKTGVRMIGRGGTINIYLDWE